MEQIEHFLLHHKQISLNLLLNEIFELYFNLNIKFYVSSCVSMQENYAFRNITETILWVTLNSIITHNLSA